MTVPLSGRVLPVTTSIIVVLPAPFGPMMARISPGSMAKERLLSALKPSNETRDALDIEQRALESLHRFVFGFLQSLLKFHRPILIPPGAVR